MQKTLGDKINEILNIKNINRSELSRLTGISTGLLSDICNNKRTSVTTDTLKRIARAVNIHPAYFLEEGTVSPADILPHLTEEERKFVLNPDIGLPWIKLSREASDKGLSPEKIKQIIKIILE